MLDLNKYSKDIETLRRLTEQTLSGEIKWQDIGENCYFGQIGGFTIRADSNEDSMSINLNGQDCALMTITKDADEIIQQLHKTFKAIEMHTITEDFYTTVDGGSPKPMTIPLTEKLEQTLKATTVIKQMANECSYLNSKQCMFKKECKEDSEYNSELVDLLNSLIDNTSKDVVHWAMVSDNCYSAKTSIDHVDKVDVFWRPEGGYKLRIYNALCGINIFSEPKRVIESLFDVVCEA